MEGGPAESHWLMLGHKEERDFSGREFGKRSREVERRDGRAVSVRGERERVEDKRLDLNKLINGIKHDVKGVHNSDGVVYSAGIRADELVVHVRDEPAGVFEPDAANKW